MTITIPVTRRRDPVPEHRGPANSPAQVQTSLAGAVTLDMEKGRFSNNVHLRGLNLLLLYEGGCRARCTYCGLAKDRPEVSERARNHTFIRVKWPTYGTEEILGRVKEDAGHMQRVCVAMIQDHRAFADSNAVMRRFRDETSMGISALITATVVRSREMVEEILEAGADMFTVAFDACTPELFDGTRGKGARGPHRWEHHWQVLRWGVEVFGRFKTGVHLVCGLGETERQMAEMIQRVHDCGAHTHLFAFFPEAGTVMQDVDPAPMGHYRRIQVARYLINHEAGRVEEMRFNDAGQIVDFGCDIAPLLDDGEVFMTSGCAGHDGRNACNRPFGNERPSMRQRNHPMPLDAGARARAALELGEDLRPWSVMAAPPLVSATDLAGGWEIGRRHGSRMKFFAPALKRFATAEWAPLPRFASISLTGADCALQCNHCKAKVLETMYPARRPDELWELGQRLHARGTRGALITGGSARNGTVPFLPHLGVIRRLREELGWRIVVHSGVADDRLVEGFATAGVDGVLVDVPPSAAAVREVLNLPLQPEHFLRMIDRLVEHGVRVTPHVVLGMHGGRIDGEAEVLDRLATSGIAALILVVLMPLPGTPLAAVRPPAPAELAPLFVRARRGFAHIPVVLGCARPGGPHKAMTDRLAILAGFNGIAYPADGVVGLATDLGLVPELHEVCCSLYDVEG